MKNKTKKLGSLMLSAALLTACNAVGNTNIPRIPAASLDVSNQNIVNGELQIDSLKLDQPGFATVHEDKGGLPGDIIGTSAFLRIGVHSNVRIKLQEAKAANKVHVMLRYDTDQSATFDDDKDPVVKLNGLTVLRTVSVANASIPGISVANQGIIDNQLTITSITLDKPGFVIIMSDNNGNPGEVIGTSAYFQAGIHQNVKINVNATKASLKLHTMLRHDVDNNAAFDDAVDTAVSLNGQTVLKAFALLRSDLPGLSVADQSIVANRLNVTSVTLDKPGFITIHADQGGNIGDIIGTSAFLDVGTHSEVKINIDPSKATNQLHMLLRYDADFNTTFNSETDEAVNINGQTVSKSISIIYMNVTPELSASGQVLTSGMLSVSKVTLDRNGFVVVYADVNGQPGEVIGTSSFLTTGTYSDVKILVDESKAKGKVHVILHYDSNNNGQFQAGQDMGVTLNSFLMMRTLFLGASASITPGISAGSQNINTITISSVSMGQQGFVVLHADNNGQPGWQLAVSSLLSAGTHTNVQLVIQDVTKLTSRVHAVIHYDADFSGTYNEMNDPMVSVNGQLAMSTIIISQ